MAKDSKRAKDSPFHLKSNLITSPLLPFKPCQTPNTAAWAPMMCLCLCKCHSHFWVDEKYVSPKIPLWSILLGEFHVPLGQRLPQSGVAALSEVSYLWKARISSLSKLIAWWCARQLSSLDPCCGCGLQNGYCRLASTQWGNEESLMSLCVSQQEDVCLRLTELGFTTAPHFSSCLWCTTILNESSA